MKVTDNVRLGSREVHFTITPRWLWDETPLDVLIDEAYEASVQSQLAEEEAEEDEDVHRS